MWVRIEGVGRRGGGGGQHAGAENVPIPFLSGDMNSNILILNKLCPKATSLEVPIAKQAGAYPEEALNPKCSDPPPPPPQSLSGLGF